MKVEIDPGMLGGRNIIIRQWIKGKSVPLAAIDPDDSPIEISGVPYHEEGKLICRLKEEDMKSLDINTGVTTSGGFRSAGVMLRFKTNSNVIGIRALLSYNNETERMLQEGKNGFAFYVGTGKDKVLRYVAAPRDHQETYIEFSAGEPSTGEEKEWTIYCPLVTSIHYIRVLLCHKAYIAPPTPFAIPKPALFYGSSVSNGIAASNPANVYTSMLGRWLDMNVINWGFNGSCKGEADLARVIGDMKDLGMFVMCFDNNAKTSDFLRERHKPFFDIIRKAQPELPIIIVSRPEVFTNMAEYEDGRRKAIVRDTYEQALVAGDKNVYYVDGLDLTDVPNRAALTVDGSHPNDYEFYRIAQGLLPMICHVLKKQGYTV